MTQLAAQMYTLREYCKDTQGLIDSLTRVRRMGYEAVQLSGHGPVDNRLVKEKLDELGLTVAATHTNFERMQEHLDEVIAENQLFGCAYPGVGSMPAKYSQAGAQGVKQFAREATQIAQRMAEAGLQLIYHNHNFEFARCGQDTLMDILLAESGEALHFELDTYWVQAGGADPIAWIRKVAPRMKVVHFKDMVYSPEQKAPIMAEIGEGNLNWPGIIQACADTGVRWHIVEQDVCQRCPFESLKISLDNLHKLDLS